MRATETTRQTKGDRFAVFCRAPLVAVTVLFGVLRYQPWIEGSTASRDFAVEARATPWVGPVSLFVVGMLVASCVIAVVAPLWVAGLVTSCAGWLITFLASLAIVASSELAVEPRFAQAPLLSPEFLRDPPRF